MSATQKLHGAGFRFGGLTMRNKFRNIDSRDARCKVLTKARSVCSISSWFVKVLVFRLVSIIIVYAKKQSSP